MLPTSGEWRQSALPIARGSVLGFFIGIVPGSAHIVACFLSYAEEKRVSRAPEAFGHGPVAGVAGPGVGQHFGFDRRLRAHAGARPADRACHGSADGGC
jgi:putative tricarboxylic transport membrane protein